MHRYSASPICVKKYKGGLTRLCCSAFEPAAEVATAPDQDRTGQGRDAFCVQPTIRGFKKKKKRKPETETLKKEQQAILSDSASDRTSTNPQLSHRGV